MQPIESSKNIITYVLVAMYMYLAFHKNFKMSFCKVFSFPLPSILNITLSDRSVVGPLRDISETSFRIRV